MNALGLGSVAEYRVRLEHEPAEWVELDRACRVTISRFYRDRGVFERLSTEVLPSLAERAEREGRGTVSAWSAGCASGEEAWSLALVWRMVLEEQHPQLEFSVLATDFDEALLNRARAARYGATSLRELPEAWKRRAFEPRDGELALLDDFRRGVTFACRDLRVDAPKGPFDLILCRNLGFTYFGEPLQRVILERIETRLRPGGILVIGRHEKLPMPHGLEALGRGGDFFYSPPPALQKLRGEELGVCERARSSR